MSQDDAIPLPSVISLPDIPVLCAHAHGAVILTNDGEVLTLSHQETRPYIDNAPVMVCHAPQTKSRLGFDAFYPYDVLELFAFVHPARFCVPTPAGLAQALHLNIPADSDDFPFTLMECARVLLRDLQNDPYRGKADPLNIAALMGLKGKGWSWTPFIFAALGHDYNPETEIFSKSTLNVWKHLPEWAEDAPLPPANHEGISEEETLEQLQSLLNTGDKTVEPRPQQKIYSTDISKVFAPMQSDESPHIALAEAGTGIGKTLGYLAPASLWAEKNDGAVWVSTYTKNLQQQIDSELDRLYPHPAIKDAYVSIRKGRENYLCLLNYEDMAAGAALSYDTRHTIAAGIMARWIVANNDGDLSGSQFPGWLSGLLGIANTYGLSDRRGECIYSACDHYNRCFVERSIRKAKRARIVIANHALVMIQSAMASAVDSMPTRYIFDEGHHLFDAADSAFSAHLTARETADLRRWILGAEGRGSGKQNRARGLKRRIEDLIEGDDTAVTLLNAILYHANVLCAPQWSRRFKDSAPIGATESFLMHIHRIVYARADGTNLPYSIETPLTPIDPDMRDAAQVLRQELSKLLSPMDAMSKLLHQKLVDDQGEMAGDTRKRLEALSSSLERRGTMTLKNWIAMLETITEEQNNNAGFADWLEITRIDGKAIDIGFFRHYIDPMKPFATSIRPHVHGMAITSATLCDQTNDEDANWQAAQERTGVHYLTKETYQTRHKSPFDYAEKTKVFIVNDVNKNDLAQVASAYRALFTASNGGALGLFTAIHRLKAVYETINVPLEERGIPLYAQHSDTMDTGTLIEIFKADMHACLLGTDAVRDGVDVPGDALRLLVFDRVPWPRPTILHKTRREAFGKRRYDEMITRLKLKQAFGRLIRRSDDHGVFVMLDSMLPSRLHGAFPEDVEIVKTGLSDVIQSIKNMN